MLATGTTTLQLRRYAVRRSLFQASSITDAVNRLGYVQADPIRAPARAQDLILFQRVAGYRIDDLESQFTDLPLMEDTIYNYGFFPLSHHALLHPRAHSPYSARIATQHRPIRAALLTMLATQAEVHPRDAERAIGGGKRINGWGGSSSKTTMMLDMLHREGLARVVRREKGIRIYATQHAAADLAPEVRARGLVHTIVYLYAPISRSCLLTFLRLIEKRRPGVHCQAALADALRDGIYRAAVVAGVEYIWPADEDVADDCADGVRLLAPFDPIVWDRKRFAHFWNWDYRFEAYVPAHKRIRGYYALPMLWRDDVIGWANVRTENGNVIIAPGLSKHIKLDSEFHMALDHEATRIARFLTPRDGDVGGVTATDKKWRTSTNLLRG